MAADLKHLNVDAQKACLDEALADARRNLEAAHKRLVGDLEQASRLLATAPASLAELLGKAVDARVQEFKVEDKWTELYFDGARAGNVYVDLSRSTARTFGNPHLKPGAYRVVVLVLPVDDPGVAKGA